MVQVLFPSLPNRSGGGKLGNTGFAYRDCFVVGILQVLGGVGWCWVGVGWCWVVLGGVGWCWERDIACMRLKLRTVDTLSYKSTKKRRN